MSPDVPRCHRMSPRVTSRTYLAKRTQLSENCLAPAEAVAAQTVTRGLGSFVQIVANAWVSVPLRTSAYLRNVSGCLEISPGVR
jgi:hypothetical protein